MQIDSPYRLDRRKTRQGFERAAATYDANAILQREVGARLTERLDLLKMQPETVLDLGCGTGAITEHLLKRYKKARVIGVDLAFNMVQKTRKRGGWFRKPQGVCADAAQLPFCSQSVEMLVSNLMLQWCNDLGSVFSEFVRVLKPNGAVLFSTFGPDTLKELRTSWSKVDNYTHTSHFPDMHDVGDALLQAGFRDPVMDCETITLTYHDVQGLLRDLKGIGANNATHGRNHGLTGKARLQAFLQAYEYFRTDEGLYPATYEVVYGHAWAPQWLPSALPEKFIPIRKI